MTPKNLSTRDGSLQGISLFAAANANHERFAIITGASSGIGLAIAEELASREINLVLVALPGTGLEDVAIRLAQTHSIKVYFFCADLTHPAAPIKLFEECRQRKICPQILVNNAGFGNLELFESTDLNELLQMMRLNTQALVALTHLFIPILKQNRRSYILNLGSLAAFFKIPYKAVYSATKSFVYSFSAALRLELQSMNISVSCLCPGSTLTSARVRDILQRTSGKNPLFVQSPEAVARRAVNKMFAGQFRIVPGLHNRILLFLYSLIPEPVTEGLLLKIFKPMPALKPQLVVSIQNNAFGWGALGLANR